MERKLPLTHLGNGLLPTTDFALTGAVPCGTPGGEGGCEHLEDIYARVAAEQGSGEGEVHLYTRRAKREAIPPRPPGLFSSASLAAPLPKGLAPAPSPPSRPGSNRRSLGHWRPRLARGHPRSVGKRHHFQCPWSIPKLQQAARLHSCQ